MKNTFRIIIYSIIFVICLSGGVYGYLVNYNENKITTEENELLSKIITNFNQNERILYLKEHNNIIETRIDNKTISFKNITSIYTNKYYATYKDGYLYYDFDKSNSIQNAIFKILVSSVSEMYGRTYDEVIRILDSQDLQNFIIENGLSYTSNGDEVNAIINTNVPINAFYIEEPSSIIEDISSTLE